MPPPPETNDLPYAEPLPEPAKRWLKLARSWAARRRLAIHQAWLRVGLSWRLWVWSLIATWVLFVVGNAVSTVYHFDHLVRFAPPDLGEWQRLSRVADGATRRDMRGREQPYPSAALLRNVAVVSGRYTRLIEYDRDATGGGRLRLTAEVLLCIQTQLEGELDGVPPVGMPDDSLCGLVALRLELLHLRHEYLKPEHRAALRRARIEGRQGKRVLVFRGDAEETLRKVANLLWKAEGDNLTDPPNVPATVWTIDPWSLSRDDLAKAVGKGRLAVTQARAQLSQSVAERSLTDRSVPESPAWADYYRELNRLIPLEANPHLELFPRPQDWPPPQAQPAGFTVVFFPSDRSRKAETQTHPVSIPMWQAVLGPAAVVMGNSASRRSPPVSASPAKPFYTYCLEVTPDGGWTEGWGVDARFTLLAPDTPLMPIRRASEPVSRVLSRGAGWLGFRPVAVRVTEEQLAGRFFPVLDDLARGAGTQPPDLRPDERDAAPVVAFVRRLLETRLGKAAARPADPPQSFAAQADPDRQFGNAPLPLEDWVVWPRRFNGGTGWGVIQFAVVFLAVRFAAEWGVVYWLVRRAGLCLANHTLVPPVELAAAIAVARGGSPQRLVEWLRIRTYTLRGIVAVLPVVGFLGTVAGLSNSLIGSSGVSSESPSERQAALQAMEVALGTAFDKSMLAFAAVIACLTAERWLSWRIGQVS